MRWLLVLDGLIPDDERHYAGLAAAALNIPIGFLTTNDCQLLTGPTKQSIFRLPLNIRLGSTEPRIYCAKSLRRVASLSPATGPIPGFRVGLRHTSTICSAGNSSSARYKM
jgi:hypothetical protein